MLREKRPRADHDVVADIGVAHDDRAHANQRIRPDMAGVHHGIVPNDNTIIDPYRRITHHMNRRVLLNVGILSNRNWLKISAHDSTEPDTRTGSDGHVADHSRRGRDKCRFINNGSLPAIGQNDFIHQYAPPSCSFPIFIQTYYNTLIPSPTRVFSGCGYAPCAAMHRSPHRAARAARHAP